jgi:predicted N-acetyltransferase YhbS
MAGRLQVIAPGPQKHREEMFELIAKVFSHRGYFQFRDRLREYYVDHSHYDWTASRIGILDGRIVTHFGIWDYQMRIGAARVRVAGVGAVATHQDCRKRGYMKLTAQASVAGLRERGYDLSLLFGIPDFYHRFGFTRAFAESDHCVRPGDLPSAAPARPLRRFRFRPRPDLERLYNRAHAHVTGTAVRPTYSRPNTQAKYQGYLWTGPRGRPAGYVAVIKEGSRLSVIEAVGDAEQVLRATAQLARKLAADQVRFANLPYDTPLARRLRQGACTLERRYHRLGGPMVRVVNLASTLRKMCGELSRRLRASHLARWRGALAVSDSRETVVLELRAGRVRIARKPSSTGSAIRGGHEVAQLLVGTDDPLEIRAQFRLRLSGAGRELLPVLFPDQHPTLHLADYF